MKLVASIVAAVAALLLAGTASAQVSAAAGVVAGTSSSAGVINVISNPATGATASSSASSSFGTLANPQWVMGQSTIAPAVTSYDACTRTRSGSILSVGAGWTQSDEDCVKQRQAEWLRQAGQQAAAVERMCDIEGVRDALARAPGYQCAATVAARNAAAAKVQPVAAPVPVAVVQPTAYVPPPGCRVVQPGNYVSCQ